MYFAIDLDQRKIVDDEGFTFTVKEFTHVVNRFAEKGKTIDMTLMCQRFLKLDCNWDALTKFYEEN